MEIVINSNNINNLLSRQELIMSINYEGALPSREEIKNKIAAILNKNKDLIIIQKIFSKFGIEEAKCFAKIYFTKEKLNEIEPKHMILRNENIKENENTSSNQ